MASDIDDVDETTAQDEEPSTESVSPTPKKGSIAQGLYVWGYVFTGIRRHKRRSLSLLIGIMIGVALVTSVFVWTDTGARVAIDDYFADTPFHYYCVQSPNYPYDDPNAIYPVRDFVNNQETTRSSHIVYGSVGLFEARDFRPDVQYLPWPYMRGIKDAQALFTDNDFLTRAERSFDIIAGSFRVGPGQVLLSRRVVEDLYTVMGLEVTVGTTIDISIARTYYGGTIGALNLAYLGDKRVAGIYEVRTTLDPLLESFPTYSRVNWGPFSGQEVVFGWLDSMILSNTELTAADYNYITLHVTYPRLLVEVNPVPFYAAGLENTVPILDRLFATIEESFDVFLGGRSALNSLINYIQSYTDRRTMGILVLPIIILSVLLTTFTTSLFISGRRPEIAILRSRGASYRQLYGTLLLEFLILAVVGLVIGGFLGVLIGCLIPSAVTFLLFDLSIFMRYLTFTQLNPFSWLFAALVVILPAAIYTIFITRSFLKTELYSAIRGDNSRWKIKTWMQVAYVALVIVVFWPLINYVISVPLTIDMALLLFIGTVAFWVILTDATARVLRPGIAGFSNLLRPVFGQKSTLFAKSVKVRRSRIVPLLIILLLTFSVTFFSAVEAQTYQVHLNRQIEYYIGADIRIYSGPVPAQRVQEITALPQIYSATPFIEVRANLGQTEFRLHGIDPASYAQVGKWDQTSMVGDDYLTVLNRLEANPNGIILPEHLATLWNKAVGDPIDIRVWDQRIVILETKTFEVVGIMRTAPGFGYANPSDPGASVSTSPGFGFQTGNAFAFVHEDYFLVEVPSWKVYDYVNLTQTFLARLNNAYTIQSALNALQSIDFVYYTWAPQTFDLESAYPDGYLFSQGIISLLSVGFLAALSISVVALTIFVNTIVSERRTEYAIMRALGGTRRQITAIVLGEFVGLILAAFIFSLIIGVIFSWVLMFSLLQLFPQPYVIPFSIIYPFSLLIAILGLVILGLIAGAYLPARRAGQVEVSNLLRNL
ncbi:MAG: ABC transporter permease [Promethearchaeota archaeon]